MARKAVLERAKVNKNDEFYTLYEDIAVELPHYKEFLKDKTIYCNCDDPRWSNFWKYLHEHFAEYQLKELISTHLEREGHSFIATYKGGNDSNASLYERTELEGDGSFDSPECLEILKRTEAIITNPPFSIANKRFLPLLLEKKDFLIIGDNNWAHLRGMEDYIVSGKVRIGYNIVKNFTTVEGKTKQLFPKIWYTSFPIEKDVPFLPLKKSYYDNKEKYPHYDNYNAIEVSRIENIPFDYDGVMGVPVTFLAKWNPKQFKLVRSDAGASLQDREFRPTKKYENCMERTAKGDLVNGNDTNNGACIEIKEPLKGKTYYITEDGRYLIKKYARWFIQKISD